MNKELIEEVLEFIDHIEEGTEMMCPSCHEIIFSPHEDKDHKAGCKLSALRKKLNDIP